MGRGNKPRPLPVLTLSNKEAAEARRTGTRDVAQRKIDRVLSHDDDDSDSGGGSYFDDFGGGDPIYEDGPCSAIVGWE